MMSDIVSNILSRTTPNNVFIITLLSENNDGIQNKFSEYFIMKLRFCLCLIIFFVVYFTISLYNETKTESFEGSTKATVNFKEVMFDGKPALLVVDLDGSVVKDAKQVVGIDENNTMTFDEKPTSTAGNDGDSTDIGDSGTITETVGKENTEVNILDIPPPGSAVRVGTSVDDSKDKRKRVTHREISDAFKLKYPDEECADFKEFMGDDSMKVDPIIIKDLIPDYADMDIIENANKELSRLNNKRADKVATCRVKYNNIVEKFVKFSNDRKLNKGDYEIRGIGCNEYAGIEWKARNEKEAMRLSTKTSGKDFDDFRNTITKMEFDTMQLVDKKRDACLVKFTRKESDGAVKLLNNKKYLAFNNGAMDLHRNSHVWKRIEVMDGDKLKGIQFESVDTGDKYANIKNSCLTLKKDNSAGMNACDPNDPSQMFKSTSVKNSNGRHKICHENQTSSEGLPLCFSNSSKIIKAMTPELEDNREFRWKMVNTYA